MSNFNTSNSTEKIHIDQTIRQDVFLRQDLSVGYELKCMKATGEPYIFDNATIQFSDCLDTYLQNGNIDDAQFVIDQLVSNITSVDRYELHSKVSVSISRVCRDLSVPTKCMEMYKLNLLRCLNADEMETLNSVQRVMEKILSLTCEDDGRYFVSLTAGEANQCIRTQIDSMKICSKEFKHVLPVQDGTLQFKLRIGSRE